LTLLVPVVWISVTLLFLAFWSRGFTLVQDIVVFIVSMLLLFGTIVAMWVSFGVGQFRRWVG
jgi:hypothetical protein